MLRMCPFSRVLLNVPISFIIILTVLVILGLFFFTCIFIYLAFFFFFFFDKLCFKARYNNHAVVFSEFYFYF